MIAYEILTTDVLLLAPDRHLPMSWKFLLMMLTTLSQKLLKARLSSGSSSRHEPVVCTASIRGFAALNSLFSRVRFVACFIRAMLVAGGEELEAITITCTLFVVGVASCGVNTDGLQSAPALPILFSLFYLWSIRAH